MSFAAEVQARFVVAKLGYSSQLGSDLKKTKVLPGIVAPITPPVTESALNDSFEKAIQNGLDPKEAKRLRLIVISDIALVNDPAQYAEKLTAVSRELSALRSDIAQPATLKNIIDLIPKELRAKLSEEETMMVAREVQKFAVEIVNALITVTTNALTNAHDHGGRAAGCAQLRRAIDAYRTLQTDAMKPLDGLKR